MQYLGDYTEDYATLNFKFSTHKSDGTPITLAGTPVVKVYKANSTTTETATGVTLTVDFDSVTGLHNVLIDLSADAFYAVANDYAVVITTGTVDSVSVVGTVLAHFSIENRFNETVVSDKTGFSLSNSGVDAIFDRNSSLSISFEDLINRIYMINSFPLKVTDATGAVVLRNAADLANVATGTLSDDLTTTIRTVLAWA
jgi:hypothetical protein